MLILFYRTFFTALTYFQRSYFVSNNLNVFKELYVYFIVKYVNLLKCENSVNRTVIAKRRIISGSQNNKTNLTKII